MGLSAIRNHNVVIDFLTSNVYPRAVRANPYGVLNPDMNVGRNSDTN